MTRYRDTQKIYFVDISHRARWTYYARLFSSWICGDTYIVSAPENRKLREGKATCHPHQKDPKWCVEFLMNSCLLLHTVTCCYVDIFPSLLGWYYFVDIRLRQLINHYTQISFNIALVYNDLSCWHESCVFGLAKSIYIKVIYISHFSALWALFRTTLFLCQIY